jgi:hypothetical protein
MSDSPSISLEPCVTITPWSVESTGILINSIAGTKLIATTSTTWPSTNLALFFPFFLSKTIKVLNLFWVDGSANSGNVDVGIYTADGTKLVSTGSQVQGINGIQSVSVSLELGPGLFYLAIAMDNTTGALQAGTTGGVGNLESASIFGAAQMASAFPLPATATLATVGQDYIPVFGLSTRSVV